MNGYQRYAIYYAPPPGPLARFGAAWLGWDAAAGRAMPHPRVDGLVRPVDEITAKPRRYGFHATMKPPFRLAAGSSADALHRAAEALARDMAPVSLDGLRLARLGGFLALTPLGDTDALGAVAAQVVEALDPFRAPPTEADLARRRAAGLSPRQETLLARWGYPHVMEEFRFHITLTGPLPPAEAETVRAALVPHLDPLLPRPFAIASLCLFGEDGQGRFHQLRRYPLTGGGGDGAPLTSSRAT